MIRDSERFTNPGYLDNPNLCLLDKKEDMESLQKYLTDCGYVDVEVSNAGVTAGVTELARDSGFLWADVREWFQDKFPFCVEFICDEWDNVAHFAEYIKDNRGDMSDDDIRVWIPEYPDLSNYAIN